MPSHIEAARNAILCYINETGKSDFVNGKMIFLQGSPEMKEQNGIQSRAPIGYCGSLCSKISSKKPITKLGNQLY